MTVVARNSPYEQALAWLRERIADGTWPLGTRIPTEPELTAELGVGRNTLREAVKCLTSTGMLEIRRGDGTYVRARSELGGLMTRRVALHEMFHVFEVRRALEAEAVRLACERRTEADLAALRAALGRRELTGGGAEFAEADLAFHTAVVHAAHNPVLEELFTGIIEPVRAIYDATDGVYQPEFTAAEHTALIDALQRRDPQGAARCACGYLNATFSALLHRRDQAEGAPDGRASPSASAGGGG